MSLENIKSLCSKKLKDLGFEKNQDYNDRLRKELSAIDDQQMTDYFMSCREASQASGKIKNSINSLVAFLLDIAKEDPIKTSKDLVVTKYAEFPDIDSDFEDSKRDLVKQYLISKYGQNNVASIITFSMFKAKNLLKDVCRIEGVPFEEVGEITKHFKVGKETDTIDSAYDSSQTVRDFFDKYQHKKILEKCRKLEGNVRQAGKHAAGVVVSPVDLRDVVGLMVNKGATVTCWEEGIQTRELSKVGLIKFDILGLSTLTVNNEARKLIEIRTGDKIDLNKLDIFDQDTLDEFKRANTIGVFQFEKPDVRDLLKLIKISSFEDISAVNALNRPGPLDTGMDEKFWKIKNKVEEPNYLHEKLRPILEDTYSIILYQEQIIKIAEELSKWGPDESDNFRRILTKDSQKARESGINPLEKVQNKFVSDCIANGISGKIKVKRVLEDGEENPASASNIRLISEKADEKGKISKHIECEVELADEIFDRMKSFARYGFNKCVTGQTKIRLNNLRMIKVSTLFANKDKLIGNVNMRPAMSFVDGGGDSLTFGDNEIVDCAQSGVQQVYALTTRNGRRKLRATGNHKIRTGNGWKELKDISIGDKILTMQFGKFVWDDIFSVKMCGKEMTYDVMLKDQSHPYWFANGIAVHNSHSSAYAYVAFQSMYLKSHYPLEFMATLLSYTKNETNPQDDMNYFNMYVEEAKRMGIKILPPSINKSRNEFVIDGESLYSGFSFIKGVGDKALDEVISKRPFKSFGDFLMKIDGRKVNKKVIHALIYSGAFDEFMASGTTIRDRYEFMNEFYKYKKDKKSIAHKPTLVKAIELEAELCGGEIFHTVVSAYNIPKINKKYEIDEQIMDFSLVDKIDTKRTIRLFGRVERLFVKNVAFVDVRNGTTVKSFAMWKDGVEYMRQHPEIRAMLESKSVITFKVTRSKDYNGKKTFTMHHDSIELLEAI
jgi:DNA polymerase III alpha subunit